MTGQELAARAAARIRHPSSATPPARQLRVVPIRELGPRARRRRVAALATCVAALVGAGLFAVVAAHVVLTQDQFRLEQVQAQVAVEQQKVLEKRLEVAQMESPQRIVGQAEQRLHMVVPTRTDYVLPTPPPASLASTHP